MIRNPIVAMRCRGVFAPLILTLFLSSYGFAADTDAKAVDPRAIEKALEAIGWSSPQVPEARADTTMIDLGRRLFFDPRLSGNHMVSCASCHNPGLGWTDGLPRFQGLDGKPLGRKTPSILNSGFYPLLFWDGRAKSLEEQALGPIQSPREMNQNLNELVLELNRLPEYVLFFRQAFSAKPGITPANIGRAIASFEKTVNSSQSVFSRFIEDRSALNASQQRGLLLFTGKARCVLCHSGPVLSDGGFHSIGVKVGPNSEDKGRYGVVPVRSMRGAFKTPALLDIARIGPYMHDGSVGTLWETIELYDRGGDSKENIDPLIKPLNLSHSEKEDLMEFLLSLTSSPQDIRIPTLPATWSPATLKEVMLWNLERVKMLRASLNQEGAHEAYLNAVGLQDNLRLVPQWLPPPNEKEEFLSYLNEAEKAAGDLAREANGPGLSPEKLQEEFKRLAASCNQCHHAFRKEGLVRLE